jgi:hypothetical protein
MSDLQRDPIINAIQHGMKRDIRVCLENRRFRGTVILTYSGMDVMAFLGMPPGQSDVTRSDFIRWADRYIRFPCKEQVTGADFYGARCALLHTYTVESRMSREGKCRRIGYMDKSVPEVLYNPAKSTELVLVSIPDLVEAFFRGIDKFFVDAFSDQALAPLMEQRLQMLIQVLSYSPTD